MSLEKDVDIVSHDIAYQGYFRLEKYKVRFKLFEGGWSHICDREIFERGSAVAVLPYDPVQDKVILIEQFRMGALKDQKSPWLLETVAGVIDTDETIEEVAKRETKEEAHLNIQKLVPICDYWSSPGSCTEQVHLFCGIVDSTQAGDICGLEDECENIRVHVIDRQEAYAFIQSGMVNQPPAIIALQWLMLLKNTETR